MKITIQNINGNTWSVITEDGGRRTERDGFASAVLNLFPEYGFEGLLRYSGPVLRELKKRLLSEQKSKVETSLAEITALAETGREFHQEVIDSLEVVPDGDKCVVDCDERAIHQLWWLFQNSGCNPSDPISPWKPVGEAEQPASFLIVTATEEKAREVIGPWMKID